MRAVMALTNIHTATALAVNGFSFGEGEADGEADGGVQTYTQAQVDEMVSGLRTKNAALLGAQKELTGQLKNWDGLDPVAVRTTLDAVNNNEEMRLLASGDTEGAFAKRLETVTAKHQSALDTLTSERDAHSGTVEQLSAQVRDLIIDQQVTAAFIGEKGLETAVTDVVLRAKGAFKIEEGLPVARDAEGQIIRGSDGPITIEEWVVSRKKDAPHWFPRSTTPGADGGDGGGGSDVHARMHAAAEAGNVREYRRLRKEAAAARTGG